jgi:hypothetical protein
LSEGIDQAQVTPIEKASDSVTSPPLSKKRIGAKYLTTKSEPIRKLWPTLGQA